jgi:hypothetical protein
MTELHRSSVLVGFYGDTLDPEGITDLLGCKPTVGVRKGGTWHTSRGYPKIASVGSWRLKAEECKPADLDGQINHLLDKLTDDLLVWRSLAEQYRAVIFCGLFLHEGNEGVELRPQTLARMGERGLIIDLDIYSNSDDAAD